MGAQDRASLSEWGERRRVADLIHQLFATEEAVDKLGASLLLGLTGGGRAITLVVQETIEPTTWLLITGWDATAVERRLIERL